MDIKNRVKFWKVIQQTLLFTVFIAVFGTFMSLTLPNKASANTIGEMAGLDSDIWYTANESDTPLFEGKPTATQPFYSHSLNVDQYHDLMIHFKVTYNTGTIQPVESFLYTPIYYTHDFVSAYPYTSTSLTFDTSRANELSTQVIGNDGGGTFNTMYVESFNDYATTLDITKPLGGVLQAEGLGHYTNLADKASLEISIPLKVANDDYNYNDPSSIPFAITQGLAFHAPTWDWTYQYRSLTVRPYKGLLVSDFNSADYNNLIGADKYNGITKMFYDTSGIYADQDTNPIEETDHSKATVDSIVPTTTPGQYTVTYTYNGVTKKVTATLKSYIDAKDFTVGYGSNWNSQKFNGVTKLTDTNGSSETPSDSNVTITIKDSQGNTVNSIDTTNAGAVYAVTYKNINGDSKTVKVTVGQRGYTPSNNGGNSSNNNNANNNTGGNSGNNAWNPSNPNNPNGTGLPNYAAVKGSAVYATKKIYMYKHGNFKKSQRVATYPKQKRINRPMFVVTGYTRSNGGALRYKVRDVNHHSKTAGKRGYITANRKYVVRVYYQSVPKNKLITVINPKGVHAYKNRNLTNRVKHYKKGSHLRVKKIVKWNLTTRYVLTNGHYITANKKLVIQGKY
ncbi:Bacterial Ig-like domain (group 3) [Lentilactobacillus parabuchneri]|nr:Bacterial Ig-like domain (group 3) [Lentilactobacillus parabuchneri]